MRLVKIDLLRFLDVGSTIFCGLAAWRSLLLVASIPSYGQVNELYYLYSLYIYMCVYLKEKKNKGI